MVPDDGYRMALHRTRQAYADGFVESFNGSFRDECHNETLFAATKPIFLTNPASIGRLGSPLPRLGAR